MQLPGDQVQLPASRAVPSLPARLQGGRRRQAQEAGGGQGEGPAGARRQRRECGTGFFCA